MGWRNWLEEEVEVVLTVLNQAAEAAYSVQAFDWSCGKGRPKEGDTVRLVNALFSNMECVNTKPILKQQLMCKGVEAPASR